MLLPPMSAWGRHRLVHCSGRCLKVSASYSSIGFATGERRRAECGDGMGAYDRSKRLCVFSPISALSFFFPSSPLGLRPIFQKLRNENVMFLPAVVFDPLLFFFFFFDRN